MGSRLIEGAFRIRDLYTGETVPPFSLFLFGNFVCMTESFILQ